MSRVRKELDLTRNCVEFEAQFNWVEFSNEFIATVEILLQSKRSVSSLFEDGFFFTWDNTWQIKFICTACYIQDVHSMHSGNNLFLYIELYSYLYQILVVGIRASRQTMVQHVWSSVWGTFPAVADRSYSRLTVSCTVTAGEGGWCSCGGCPGLSPAWLVREQVIFGFLCPFYSMFDHGPQYFTVVCYAFPVHINW